MRVPGDGARWSGRRAQQLRVHRLALPPDPRRSGRRSDGTSAPRRTRRPGGPRVAILSDALWQRRFNADSAVLGRSIVVDGNPFTIVGVSAAGIPWSVGQGRTARSRSCRRISRTAHRAVVARLLRDRAAQAGVTTGTFAKVASASSAEWSPTRTRIRNQEGALGRHRPRARRHARRSGRAALAARLVRRGRARAAHCVRERRESLSRPRGRATP